MIDKINPLEGFVVRTPTRPKWKRISFEEAENILLARLATGGPGHKDCLTKLAWFYSCAKLPMKSLEYLQKLCAITDDPEDKAYYYLSIGMKMEKMNNYQTAAMFYKQAFLMEPINTRVWYYINNNLGYCLNKLGRYVEAKNYCRSAIRISPNRFNAYKNLGISLAGQGDYRSAAENFITATRRNASDPRALTHLEELIAQHGELDMPDLFSKLEKCRNAVKMASEIKRKALKGDNADK